MMAHAKRCFFISFSPLLKWKLRINDIVGETDFDSDIAYIFCKKSLKYAVFA